MEIHQELQKSPKGAQLVSHIRFLPKRISFDLRPPVCCVHGARDGWTENLPRKEANATSGNCKITKKEWFGQDKCLRASYYTFIEVWISAYHL